jgi:hypothetical protein
MGKMNLASNSCASPGPRSCKFFTVDLLRNTIRSLDFHLDRKLTPVLDILGDRACLSDSLRVYLVDLKEGKVLRRTEFPTGVQDVGLVNEQRGYVVAGNQLEIVDLAEGKTLHTIRLGDAGRMSGRGGIIADGASRRVVVPMGAAKPSLAVIDPESGKVIEQIAMPGMRMGDFHYAGDLQVVGEKVYVLGVRLGYGVWTETLGCVNVKERTFNLMKLPAKGMLHDCSLVGGRGTLFLTGHHGAYQYDAEGKLVGPVLGNRDPRLVGVCKWQALLLKDTELQRKEFPLTTAKAE